MKKKKKILYWYTTYYNNVMVIHIMKGYKKKLSISSKGYLYNMCKSWYKDTMCVKIHIVL